MDKIRVVLADDHEDSMDILKYYIGQVPDFEIVRTCENGAEIVDALMTLQPDVVLLDVNMPEMNGIEAIRACLKIKPDLLFVFVTSYDEFAVEAFELSAVDYIVKPIIKTRLYASLEKVLQAYRLRNMAERARVRPQRLVIKELNSHIYIPVEEILFIEKVGKKCHIHTSAKCYQCTETLNQLLDRLPRWFYLSHRSYIVNVTRINQISMDSQTYLAFFAGSSKYAHVSKLKIDELQDLLKCL